MVSVEDGVLKALKVGHVTISATTVNGKIATCEVDVFVKATDVSINKSEIELKPGQGEQLTVTLYPSDATDYQRYMRR